MHFIRNNTFFQRNLVLITVFLVCSFFIGCGERSHKKELYRVGIMGGVEAFSDIAEGFKRQMTEFGYVEGKNIVYDTKIGNFDQAGLQQVAEKFVKDQVDLIFAFPSEPAFAAKAATQGTDIPVVFSIAGIEGNDLVESVRQPGGSITGVRYPGPDLVVKRFEILYELAPHIKRHYVPYDPNYPNNPPSLRGLREVASSHGVVLVEDPVSNLEELQDAVKKRAASDDMDIDSIQILPEALTQTPGGWTAIRTFAEEHKLPLVGSMLLSADMGAIFSYCVDFIEVGKQAAPIADKVLKGVPAGTIPLATPEPRLRLNYKLIQKLGLTVSEGLLSRADEIIR